MFWENFVDLCSQNGTSPNAVAAELGKSSGSVTAWKNGAVPRETTLKKIAEHFSVTVDRLVYGQKEKPTPVSESGSVNVVKIAGRDGSYFEKRLSDAQLSALKAMVEQLPDAPDGL